MIVHCKNHPYKTSGNNFLACTLLGLEGPGDGTCSGHTLWGE